MNKTPVAEMSRTIKKEVTVAKVLTKMCIDATKATARFLLKVIAPVAIVNLSALAFVTIMGVPIPVAGNVLVATGCASVMVFVYCLVLFVEGKSLASPLIKLYEDKRQELEYQLEYQNGNYK